MLFPGWALQLGGFALLAAKLAAAALLLLVLALGVFVQWATGKQRKEVADESPAPSGAEAAALKKGDTLKVATYNIHFGIGSDWTVEVGRSREAVLKNLDAIGAAVKGCDIVAIQEIDRSSDRSWHTDQLEHLKRVTGLPHAVWTTVWDVRWVPHPGLNPAKQIGGVWSANVILSRFPLEVGRDAHIKLPQPRSQATGGWYSKVLPLTGLYNKFFLNRHLTDVTAVLGPELRLRIVNGHLEAFSKANRMEQAQIVAKLLSPDGQPVEPYTLLCGDFNLNVQHPSQAKFQPEPDKTLSYIQAIPGLRQLMPTGKNVHTCPATTPRLTIDYIFTGAGLEHLGGEVLQQETPPSDHLPVVGTFKLA